MRCGTSDVTRQRWHRDCNDNCDTISNPAKPTATDGIGDVCEIANNMASDIDGNVSPTVQPVDPRVLLVGTS